MAGHLLFNSGSNESSLAPQFKWLDNTFKLLSTLISIEMFFSGVQSKKSFTRKNWLTIS
jgi:hypothetical protein